jgi:hypothetical protein
MNGKTIRISLADGEPTGILLAEMPATGPMRSSSRRACSSIKLARREEVCAERQV